ncbi:hypothetical protein F01_420145 [Burkholderia cenocepacia]|nr:hypothetical protein F01_420145 [Burkholderia cenocepacia]
MPLVLYAWRGKSNRSMRQRRASRMPDSGHAARAPVSGRRSIRPARRHRLGLSRSILHLAAFLNNMRALSMYIDAAYRKKPRPHSVCSRDKKHRLLARGWCAASIRRGAILRNIVV